MVEQVESQTVKHDALVNWRVVDGDYFAFGSANLCIEFGSEETTGENKFTWNKPHNIMF